MLNLKITKAVETRSIKIKELSEELIRKEKLRKYYEEKEKNKH